MTIAVDAAAAEAEAAPRLKHAGGREMERQMTLRLLLVCSAFVAGALGGAAYAADVGGRPFYAVLTGEAEIPDADPDGSGTARVTINPGKDQVCWELTWNNIATPTAAHIHVGDATSEGGPMVPMSPIASGCASATDAVIDAIVANPGGYYVNIHNADFPDGAVRGQLSAKKAK